MYLSKAIKICFSMLLFPDISGRILMNNLEKSSGVRPFNDLNMVVAVLRLVISLIVGRLDCVLMM